MYDLLPGLRIIEGASFVAAPTCCLHLRQLGAEVIRFDAIGGGPDFNRWPQAANGASYYWEGLNQGKKSIAIDLRSPEGRELATALASAVGLFVTNYPVGGFLSHDRLTTSRPDMITVRVMGWHDGGNALDYTVNAALGVPYMTGPVDLAGDEPVNHVLPAWDLTTGLYAAFALLAAERQRRLTGEGAEVRVPLGDVAIASLGSLGQLAEASSGHERPRVGNDIFGAFGRDFRTRDGRSIMLAAISGRQWSGLIRSLNLGKEVASLEHDLGVSFDDDEGLRFTHRGRLNPLVARAMAVRDYAELTEAFDRNGVTWGPYRSLTEAMRSDPRVGASNPLLSSVEHLSGDTYLTPGSPATIPQLVRGSPERAPRLGEHSEQILAEVLGLGDGSIGDLLDRGVVAAG